MQTKLVRATTQNASNNTHKKKQNEFNIHGTTSLQKLNEKASSRNQAWVDHYYWDAPKRTTQQYNTNTLKNYNAVPSDI